MINTENIEEAKKEIKKEPKPIIIKAKSDKFNRAILEYGRFDILLSPDEEHRKDTLKQIDSGLNPFLISLARKNEISIGIDVKSLKQEDPVSKASRLARIRQNIILCRKGGQGIKVLNCSLEEGRHLLLSLGASTSQTNQT